MFIDHARIFVKAGDGGSGHCSFRREKFVPRGGPSGGDGGHGGQVIFAASNQVSTLLDLRYQRHYTAKSGNAAKKPTATGPMDWMSSSRFLLAHWSRSKRRAKH